MQTTSFTMKLMQGKESAGRSDASSDRNDVRRLGGKLYDRVDAALRRAAHWSEREGTHNTKLEKLVQFIPLAWWQRGEWPSRIVPFVPTHMP